MILAIVISMIQSNQQPEMLLINARTNESKKYAVPSSSIIDSFLVKAEHGKWQAEIKFGGSFDPTSNEPQVLEIHRISAQNTIDVCVFQIQGSSSIEPIKQLNRGECVLLKRSGEMIMIQAYVGKGGVKIILPEAPDVKNWCAVTRWRPSELSENDSPSSLWLTSVSSVFGKSAQMQEVPSLLAFLKYEFGK